MIIINYAHSLQPNEDNIEEKKQYVDFPTKHAHFQNIINTSDLPEFHWIFTNKLCLFCLTSKHVANTRFLKTLKHNSRALCLILFSFLTAATLNIRLTEKSVNSYGSGKIFALNEYHSACFRKYVFESAKVKATIEQLLHHAYGWLIRNETKLQPSTSVWISHMKYTHQDGHYFMSVKY